MRSKELERLLGAADELVAARAQLARAEALEAEIARDRALVEQVPGLIAALERCRGSIAELARELERQWVDQGPLVAAWQRAAELEQLAAAAGVDGGEEQADAERARLQVETARLQTRELLVVLAERRCGWPTRRWRRRSSCRRRRRCATMDAPRPAAAMRWR